MNTSLYGTGGGPNTIPKNSLYDEVNKKTVKGLTSKFDDDVIDEPVEKNDGFNENIIVISEEVVVPSRKRTVSSPLLASSELGVSREIPSSNEQENVEPNSNDNWRTYNPNSIRQPKNRKQCVRNKGINATKEAHTLHNLKQIYFLQKIENLRNEDRRKRERHEKEMDVLNIQIKNQNQYEESTESNE